MTDELLPKLNKEDLAALIGDLSPEQRELLELLLNEDGVSLDDAVITSQPRQSDTDGRGYSMPLSYAQQRMWFLSQWEPDSPLYNIPSAVRLTGHVQVDLLEQAINKIVKRHEILRTTFDSDQGDAYQLIKPELDIKLTLVDLRDLAAENRHTEAMRLANEEAQRPFDLVAGPLIRTTLLQLSEQEFIALLNMHHIISDGWSTGVLIREIALFYEALLHGQQASLPKLSIQYADFAVWQQKWLKGPIFEEQIEYWANALANVPPLLDLPTDHPRQAFITSRGASYSFQIPLEVANQLVTLSNQEGVTLFMSLLAVFQMLLARYSGQEDICVGTPIANRNRSEVEPLIGFFVNTLVLRSQISGEITFRELIRQVKDVTLNAFAHQDLPFEILVEKLHPVRDTSHSPLFQVMFDMVSASNEALRLPDLIMEPVSTHTGTSKFDITLTLAQSPIGFHGEIEYNSDLYERGTIERMAEHYEELLRGVLAEPEAAVTRIAMVSEGEKAEILGKYSRGEERDYGSELVVDKFRRIAEEDPGRVALEYEGEELSYGELDERSDQLAVYLRELGVRAEVLVGLCIKRSIEMVVSLLGILKAGGAYLPLDPEYPVERLSYMLEDSGSGVVVTLEGQLEEKGELRELFSKGERKVVRLDAEWSEIRGKGREIRGSGAELGNLAYVIYTSGSTGKPKGVQIEHGSMVNFVEWAREGYGFVGEDRVLQFASLNFDTAVEEIYPTLTSGGTLVLRPEALMSFAGFREWVKEKKLTVLDLPTAYWHAWVSELEREKEGVPEGVRMVIVGGERALGEQYGEWEKVTGGRGRWMNTYGPSEATVVCLTYEPPEDWGEKVAPLMPVGRPIGNMQAYVLDGHQQLCPVGVPGELWVGGAGIARGYLKRAELTAERFVGAPEWMRGEKYVGIAERYYRTGDRARLLGDGNIDFLGRVDDQVKLRGFRIELGEIEAVLSEHPGVREVSVLMREDRPGEKQLVAYMSQVEGGEELTVGDLRGYVKGKLPEYMVPGVFVVLPALPLTPNAKIDRKALPAPEYSRLTPEYGFVAPRNPEEEILAGIWSEVLGTSSISVEDNFFDLGGHSLLVTQVLSRVKRSFGVEISVKSLFEAPTIARLADVIRHARADMQGLDISTIEKADRSGDIPLSFAQQRLWFLEEFEPGTANYNIPAAVRLVGCLDKDALQASLNEIIRRHETLRMAILTLDGKPVQQILSSYNLVIPVEDIRIIKEEDRGAEALRIAIDEAKQPFNLAEAPLIRVRLLQLDEEVHIVLLTLHHIISDGWSTSVLIRELAALYSVLVEGGRPEQVDLPELRIQYADFSIWQRNWLQGEVLQRQINYWKDKLAGSPPLLELPTDHPRQAVQTQNGGQVSFSIDSELAAAAQKISKEQGVTLFMSLLAVFQLLLYRYSGQTDISVGTPIANRNREEIEGLIGFFVNTLVLRTDISREPTFLELLARVRETALGAYAHQDVPFEMLVNELQPQRNTSHSPLFQVMFDMQNVPGALLELPGLTLSAIETTTGLAKFDLSLSIGPGESGLVAGFEYNSDLYERRTIERMAEHYEELLRGVLAEPEAAVTRIAMVSEGEKAEILGKYSRGEERDYGSELVVDRFRRIAEEDPGRVALEYEGEELSYGELDERSDQLAVYLRELGVRAEVLVGLCIKRSIEMVVSLLGILKAGGAYLPLDPEYPVERLSYMLEDSGSGVVVTLEGQLEEKGELRELFSKGERKVVRLDAEWSEIRGKGREIRGSGAELGNLAYVIYTSGSTGKPKGVQIEHGSMVNFVEWAREGYGFVGEDRVLQFASLNFDTAVEEIYPTLTSGGTLVLRPEALMSFAGFREWVKEKKLTVLDLPTAYWHAWVSELEREKEGVPEGVRMVIVGGERALGEQYGEWEKVTGGRGRWMNTYGPSEATVVCLTYEPPEDWGEKVAPLMPVGRPIGNMQAYVLDGHQQLCPVGVPGELWVGGAGIARGYLKRAELTAERFVGAPEWMRGEKYVGIAERYYRTGDRVRLLGDGNIDFLGRVDDQVKLRGFRIELGEIEAVLSEHPGVREVSVLMREDRPGEKQLVAYMSQVEGGEELTVGDLRGYVKGKLPEYMVPGVFVVLPALPLTPNAKIDRKALAALSIDTDGLERLESEFAPPRTSEEKKLAEIWSQVLGLERVGIHSNFFELGGDSILSIQVTARANQAGLQITPRQMFEAQTIAELAAAVGKPREIQAEQGLVSGLVALTPIQHWFFEQQFPRPAHWNQALLLEVSPALDVDRLKTAIAKLLDHHDILRAKYFIGQGGWVQDILGSLDSLPLEWVDLRNTEPSQVSRIIEETAGQSQTSLTLENGTLLRIVYFNAGGSGLDRLLIIIHHLVVDGVSWRILVDDLMNAYQQADPAQPDKEIQLPDKTTSYQYWAEQLTAYASSPELAGEFDFWLKSTTDVVDSMLVDYPDGENSEASEKTIRRGLEIDETRALLQDVPSTYKTEINDVLLTALVMAYTAWQNERGYWPEVPGRTSLLVALEGHGREDIFDDIDLSRTVGWFTSLFPVRLEYDHMDGHGEALKAVKEQLRNVPGRGVGYGLLRYLNPEKSAQLAQGFEPQISFNYLGQIDRGMSTANPSGNEFKTPQTNSEPDIEAQNSLTETISLRIGNETTGSAHDPLSQRANIIDINGGIAGGKLDLEFSYSINLLEAYSVERFADLYFEKLRQLIDHCLSPQAGGFTASDFPLAGIDQNQLDKLISKVSKK